jgi:hypothetical protein
MKNSALFMEITPGPPENENLYVDVSHPGRIGIHYMNRRSHQMQKHKFGATCPGMFFVEFIPVSPEREK